MALRPQLTKLDRALDRAEEAVSPATPLNSELTTKLPATSQVEWLIQ
jgi:hypothetical protein